MFDTWNRTVLQLIPMRLAICALARPDVSPSRTSTSRPVRPAVSSAFAWQDGDATCIRDEIQDAWTYRLPFPAAAIAPLSSVGVKHFDSNPESQRQREIDSPHLNSTLPQEHLRCFRDSNCGRDSSKPLRKQWHRQLEPRSHTLPGLQHAQPPESHLYVEHGVLRESLVHPRKILGLHCR